MLDNAQKILAAALAVGTIGSAAFGSWAVTKYQVSETARGLEDVRRDVKQQLQVSTESTERQVADLRTYTTQQVAALNAAREQQGKELIELRVRMEQQQATLGRIESSLNRMEDRLESKRTLSQR